VRARRDSEAAGMNTRQGHHECHLRRGQASRSLRCVHGEDESPAASRPFGQGDETLSYLRVCSCASPGWEFAGTPNLALRDKDRGRKVASTIAGPQFVPIKRGEKH